MVAPVFGASYVPPRVRIVLAGAMTLVARAAAARRPRWPDAAVGWTASITTVQQMLIGAALGFALQLMFDALTLGGQLLANGMGLGFAFNLDPLRGVTTPALGPALRGARHADVPRARRPHRADRHAGRRAFAGCRSAPTASTPRGLQSLADWGDQLFLGALRVALPGMTALLVINLAFGVMSRAAPALNLFAVGLPVTLIFGLVIVTVRTADDADRVHRDLLQSSLQLHARARRVRLEQRMAENDDRERTESPTQKRLDDARAQAARCRARAT